MGKKLETRSWPFAAELRQEGEQPALVGYAVRWGEVSDRRPFQERFLPGAFAKDLASGRDVLALVGHELSKVLARRSNGTLTLREDEAGLWVEIRPNMETSFAQDLVALVRRGDLKQMSIGFVATKDRWVNDPQVGRIREVLEAELLEVSIVSLPAYAGTSITTRGKEIESMSEEVRNEQTTVVEEERDERQEQPVVEERQQPAAEERTAPMVDVRLATPAAETRSAAFVDYLRGRPFDIRAMRVGDGGAGGFLAPDSFQAELIRWLRETSVMRQVARVVGPIAAARVTFPALENAVTAAWTPEAQSIAQSDPTFAQVEFTPHKLAALTLVSNELLADSGVNVEQMLAQLFGEELGEREDAAFFNGTGNGQPAGILQDNRIPTVPASGEEEITADDILALYDALPPQYRPNAVWIMHPAVMSVLRRLKDDNGQYLLVTGLAAAAPTTLLGRPVYLTSHMPELAAGAKTILFGDVRRAYYIVDRQGVEVQRSSDRYFEQDVTAFRAIVRTDGKVVLPDAVRFLQQPA